MQFWIVLFNSLCHQFELLHLQLLLHASEMGGDYYKGSLPFALTSQLKETLSPCFLVISLSAD